MNDPHVVSLQYRVVTDQGVRYEKPPPIKVSEDAFELTLADGVLTVTMREHHPTVPSAVDRVRDYLRAWELQAALELGRGSLGFEFEDAEVIDRNPPPPGSSVVVQLRGVACAVVSVSANIVVVKPRYPAPPTSFKVSPLVESLWARYQAFLDGRDLLTTMGYACLSLVQSDAGGLKKVVAKYSIQFEVLDKLGNLTSQVGDEMTARKFDQNSTRRPHTPSEKDWIEAAVKRLIRRVAEHDHDPTASLPEITMADLPTP